MTKEQIKEATTMREVLARYGLKADRHGMVSCAFHGADKHASMKIYKDGYHCFACGAHGDIFDFVQGMERCNFRTAFEILGGRYEKQAPTERKVKNNSYKREKEERERNDKAEADFKRELSFTITVVRKAIEICDPMGDMWTDAQNALPWLLHIWEEKYLCEGEVDELNVYRKCRAIRQRFGVG